MKTIDMTERKARGGGVDKPVIFVSQAYWSAVAS